MNISDKEKAKQVRRLSRDLHKDMPKGRVLDKGRGYRRASEARKKRERILEDLRD